MNFYFKYVLSKKSEIIESRAEKSIVHPDTWFNRNKLYKLSISV